MIDDQTKQTAYFRYAVISPLLAPEPGRCLASDLESQAERTWLLPDGQQRRYAVSTIENWLYRYRNGGIDALLDEPRRDKGSFPGVETAVAEAALKLFEEHPNVRISTVYKELVKADLVVANKPSRSTFYRWAVQHRPRRSSGPGRDRRAFEAPWSAALWQADIMYGPSIACRLPSGRTRKCPTYLVAIIDDYSRLLCEGRFFFSQNIESWLEVLRSACCRRGIPEKLYCDNGQVFTSNQIKRIGATLGIQVLHTKVRDAAAKGKIERFFLTVRTSFLESLTLQGMPRDLEALNRAFRAWSQTQYNGAPHSAHGLTPQQRWIDGAARLRTIGADEASELFLFDVERVVRKDGTFSLKGQRYEISSALAGQRILVRYEPIALTRVDVWFEGSFRGRAYRLDLHGNDGRVRDGGL